MPTFLLLPYQVQVLISAKRKIPFNFEHLSGWVLVLGSNNKSSQILKKWCVRRVKHKLSKGNVNLLAPE